MRVAQKRTVRSPREHVWGLVSDPREWSRFMDGLVLSDVLSDEVTGSGARWAVRLQIGAAALGGTVEVVEFLEPGDLAWNAVTGISVRGRWRLRERPEGCTQVELRLAYQAPGGLAGLVADRVAAPAVQRRLSRSLQALQRVAEQG